MYCRKCGEKMAEDSNFCEKCGTKFEKIEKKEAEIELKNNIADFHYNLAFVYKKLGKEKQAKTYLENYNKLTGQI